MSDHVERPRLQTDRILAWLADDAEWALAARFWTADIVFCVDHVRSRLSIVDGRATAFQPDAGDAPADLRIGGSGAAWRELLRPVPRPYFQDFLPASLHHGFTCEGNMEAFYAYYGAISRILAAMRQTTTQPG